MGMYYHNISLKGPSQDAVVAYMRQIRHPSFVSQTESDITVVFPAGVPYSAAPLRDLAQALSLNFRCVALAVMVVDSDILRYYLFANGINTDEYDSIPDYFTSHIELPEQESSVDEYIPQPPGGGNAEQLCALFDANPAVNAVTTILHPMDNYHNGYWTAEERHLKLVTALGLPPFCAYTDYKYLKRGADLYDTSAFIEIGEE